MDKGAPKDRESVSEFKRRLRRVALATPRSTVVKVVEAVLLSQGRSTHTGVQSIQQGWGQCSMHEIVIG